MTKEMRDYVVTTNEWVEVEGLGRTMHFETESVYYEIIKAKSTGQAKASFQYNGAIFCDWTELKCRLLTNVDLY